MRRRLNFHKHYRHYTAEMRVYTFTVYTRKVTYKAFTDAYNFHLITFNEISGKLRSAKNSLSVYVNVGTNKSSSIGFLTVKE